MVVVDHEPHAPKHFKTLLCSSDDKTLQYISSEDVVATVASAMQRRHAIVHSG